MARYEDPTSAGEEASPADSYRPLGQIMRDLKAVDLEIAAKRARRADLVRELRAVSDAASQYAENAESKKETTP